MKVRSYCRYFIMALFSLPQLVLAEELMVYSSRNATYIKPLFDDYSRETGVGVRYLVAPGPTLISRLSVEGEASPADLFITAGAANLWSASQKGLLSSVRSRTLDKNVPDYLKSSKGDWFAFSKRARTILYNPEKVSADELHGYADLAQSKWQGRLCLRSFKDEYSQSLVAMLINDVGTDKTEEIVNGWVSNLAMNPLDDDMKIAAAINQGLCDVGIVNSYYFARFKREQPDTKLKLFWADQDGKGVHVDITGVAVTASAKNKQAALDLLEWLTIKQTQVFFANLSMEYPANPKVYPAREVAKWGKFKEDKAPVENLGHNHKAAVALIKKNQYK
ncbi:extracellular solute-binding protein [Marinomonas algicola]|jgi:iron(III) transport system substrate-binding protein|uniref:extracellular solute-binding protein n=1 Tax=Marinomonas algicola TaxID=2773454 RepID=UPI00174B26B7|nr:extracellular solute-binding protein [Marinomonas algicola]